VRRPATLLILAAAFVLAIAGTFIFGYRAGRYAHRLRWENEPIRPWMSVPFIAHTHHVPPETLFQAIGEPPHRHDRRPLRVIAHQKGEPINDLIGKLEKALADAGHVHPAPETGAGKEH
jgi:hypothetical protein